MDNKSAAINKNISRLGHRQRIKKNFLDSETETLSDEILLELSLFMLYSRMDVKPLVKKIIHNFGNLRHFILSSEKNIKQTFAKDKKYPKCNDSTIKNLYFAAKLIRELTMRTTKQRLYDKDSTIFNTWNETISYLKQKFGHLTQENFSVIFLGASNKILDIHTFGSGTIDEVAVYDREIIKKAIDCGCVSIILVHNHFSGNVQPSVSDKELTNKISFSCKIVGIEVLDHIIVSGDNYYSFKENMLI